MSNENAPDPREVLARKKYFSLRPKPLEQWLWRHNVPPSAERVFWLHWQEGMIQQDWCSEISLKRVADQCHLDISSVTRAYQSLRRLGLIRRQDPGRDPARPFERAIAITEVRLPLELVQELNRHPDRCTHLRDPAIAENAARESKVSPDDSSNNSSPAAPRDPFEGMTGRARMRALGHLVSLMSAGERLRYEKALRNHGEMTFDGTCRLTVEQRESVLQFLAIVGRRVTVSAAQPNRGCFALRTPEQRRLSVFELARIRREIQRIGVQRHHAEVLREIAWSVEEGALRRFSTLHAVRIALKKIREGAWSRPNRMPPNWSRVLARPDPASSRTALYEACRTA